MYNNLNRNGKYRELTEDWKLRLTIYRENTDICIQILKNQKFLIEVLSTVEQLKKSSHSLYKDRNIYGLVIDNDKYPKGYYYRY
jgi:hypothetical protein